MSTSSVAIQPANSRIAGKFAPGRSGNPSGRPKSIFNREIRKQLRVELATDVTRLAHIVDSTIERAATDNGALQFLRDSIGEKPDSNSASSNQISIAIAIESVGQ